MLRPPSTPAGEFRFASAICCSIANWSSSPGGADRTRCGRWPFDLKTFFSVVPKDPEEVQASDVFDFLAHRRGDRTVVRITDGESGLSARTISRRLSSVSGLYAYLVARGDTDVAVNPVPRELSTRRAGGRAGTVPLVRIAQTLPKVLDPDEVQLLFGALRSQRGRAMVLAIWCSAPCGVVRSSACGWPTCRLATAPCSSPRAKAATSG